MLNQEVDSDGSCATGTGQSKTCMTWWKSGGWHSPLGEGGRGTGERKKESESLELKPSQLNITCFDSLVNCQVVDSRKSYEAGLWSH